MNADNMLAKLRQLRRLLEMDSNSFSLSDPNRTAAIRRDTESWRQAHILPALDAMIRALGVSRGMVKGRRTKPVLCGLCEREETKDRAGICPECRAIYKAGMDWEAIKAKQADTGLERARIFDDQRFYAFYGGADPVGDPQSRLWPALLELAGAIRPKAYHSDDDLPDAMPGGKPIGRDPESFSSHTATIILPAGNGARLQAIYNHIVNLLWKAKNDGFREGANLIGRIASGELTVQGLNELERKSA